MGCTDSNRINWIMQLHAIICVCVCVYSYVPTLTVIDGTGLVLACWSISPFSR